MMHSQLRTPHGGRLQHDSGHPVGDAAIRQTDSDAALARHSAVQKGYFTDPFIRNLLPRGSQYQPPRPPLINVGTYVRSEGIDALVDQWFDLASAEGKRCQIVSLGAGSDTRFWRISVRVFSTDVFDMNGLEIANLDRPVPRRMGSLLM